MSMIKRTFYKKYMGVKWDIIFRYVFAYYDTIRIYTGNPFGLLPVIYREWLRRSTDKPAA